MYFLNAITKQRVQEKPKDYDGEYVIGEKSARDKVEKYGNIDFTKRFCTPLEVERVEVAVRG